MLGLKTPRCVRFEDFYSITPGVCLYNKDMLCISNLRKKILSENCFLSFVANSLILTKHPLNKHKVLYLQIPSPPHTCRHIHAPLPPPPQHGHRQTKQQTLTLVTNTQCALFYERNTAEPNRHKNNQPLRHRETSPTL